MPNEYDYFTDDQKEKHERFMSIQKEKFPNRKFLFSYKYYENHDCVFFPCHKNTSKGHNCLFCKCPLYNDNECIGIQNGWGELLENGFKDCSNCSYNHDYENAEEMMRSNPK
jgi:Zn-finger protein